MTDVYFADEFQRIAAERDEARAEAAQQRGELDRLSDHYQKLMAECDAKDAEVARLRAERAAETDRVERYITDTDEQIMQLRDELERLREALTEIALSEFQDAHVIVALEAFGSDH